MRLANTKCYIKKEQRNLVATAGKKYSWEQQTKNTITLSLTHTHTQISWPLMFFPHSLIHQIKLLLLVSPHSHLRANSVSATKEVGTLLKQRFKLRKQ